MGPCSSCDVLGNQRGKFNNQKPDGSIVISASAGYNFVLSGADIASTGMGRLLAEGLRPNESLYWITQGVFEGARFDQFTAIVLTFHHEGLNGSCKRRCTTLTSLV